MTVAKIKEVPIQIPNLKISDELQAPGFDPNKNYSFHYEGKSHQEWPHVVKFSGGKTSGMLLFILLEAGMLKPERGDVIVFNNTSAEHPKTYEFVRECKRVVEQHYKIPFFLVEYQTYEDAREGEYARIPAFKLVNSEPWSESNPDGYHWRGEVFEEMLSHKGYVPTLFQRTCTQTLKLETSRLFLQEWFANKDTTERLGHFGSSSRLDDDEIYQRHLRNGGSVPRDIFLKKKKFLKNRPTARLSQAWSDYSSVFVPFNNETLKDKSYGRKVNFGKGKKDVRYVSFVGIRHDEMHRVGKIQKRNIGGPHAEGREGEYAYMPLVGMNITQDDVQGFWEKQTWKLELNKDDSLSNCTLCFLKGVRNLETAKLALKREQRNGEYKNTPCDINWWVDIEEKYGRDMKGEDRIIKTEVANNFIGFFGANSTMSYNILARDDALDKVPAHIRDSRPCDCTD